MGQDLSSESRKAKSICPNTEELSLLVFRSLAQEVAFLMMKLWFDGLGNMLLVLAIPILSLTLPVDS